MNRKQKNLIIKLVTISLITLAAVLAMFDIRAWVNYSEAQKAMEQLGKIVTRYRDKHNCVPPESYVNKLKDRIEGAARLGDFHYQGRWIDFDRDRKSVV